MPDAAPVTMNVCWDGIVDLADSPRCSTPPGTLGQVPFAGNAPQPAQDGRVPLALAVVAGVWRSPGGPRRCPCDGIGRHAPHERYRPCEDYRYAGLPAHSA